MFREPQNINAEERMLQAVEIGFIQDVMYSMPLVNVPLLQIQHDKLIQKDKVTLERQNINIKQQQLVFQTDIKVEINEKVLQQTKQIITNSLVEIQKDTIIQHSGNNTVIDLETEAFYNLNFQWKKGHAKIENNIFKLSTLQIPLSELRKVKIFKEIAVNNPHKLKLSYHANDISFFVDPQATIQNLPIQYFWFSKIITMKLHLKDFDLKHTYVLKKQMTNKNMKNPIIDGMIYKKSQHWNTWELRYAAITKEGFFSYKDETSKQSFHIKRGAVTQFWTRFDIYQKLLIVKVLHSGKKTQLAIPLARYYSVSKINWLYRLYELFHQ